MTNHRSTSANFTVTVTSTEMVMASSSPFQRHRLPVSNLDLVMPRMPLDINLFFCYSGDVNKTTSFDEKARALKKALAETLVSFYPFAGEVAENEQGEPEIDCNNRGVEFYEAEARGIELGEVNLYEPDGCARGKLVPNKKNGVFSVQITKLASGSTIVGCTFDHRVADAYTTNMFMGAWAQIATSSTTTTTTPSFGRTLLNPRSPLSFDSSIEDIFVTYSSMPPPPPPTTTTTAGMISRIYRLPASQLSALQNERTTDENTPSKLNTLSSYLWKLIAEHASQHKEVNAQNTCTMGIVVDGRQRIGPAMRSHFGNVISAPYASYKVNELTKMPLAEVAGVVSGLLANAATKEHFLGLVDWVEVHRPKPIVAKVYTHGSEAEPAFVVSSGQRFQVTEVDFGWGRPVFGSYYLPYGGSAGYVMPMPSPNENGDWIVYMQLRESQLNFIEEKASSVFVPFTLDLVTH